MKIWAIVLVGFFAFMIALGVTVAGVFWSTYNSAVDNEENIVAQYDSTKNALSNATTRIMEAAQVNDMYRDDLLEIVQATFSGRYGEDGSQASWQWLQEQNPQLDSGLYRDLQAIIAAGRKEFQTSQDRLIELRRVYIKQTRTLPTSLVLQIMGFPKIDLNKYNIIIEGGVQDRFDNGQDEILNIRPET